MAAGDKLWFELGVRDGISDVLKDLMRGSQSLANMLSDDADELKVIYKNVSDIANVYDKIYVAQKRISELKGTTLTADEKKGLKTMDKDLEAVRKEFEAILKDPNRLLEKGEAAFDKQRVNVELMIKDVMRYVDGIENKEKAEAINAANEERRIDSLKAKYYDLQRQRQELSNAIANAAPGADLTNATSLINGLSARMGAITNAQRKGTGMPGSVVGADAEEFYRQVENEIKSLSGATKDYNSALETNEKLQRRLQGVLLDLKSQQNIAYIKGQTAEYDALGDKIIEVSNLISNLNSDRSNIKGGGSPVYSAQSVTERLDAINRKYNETLAQKRQSEKASAKIKNDLADASRRAAAAVQNQTIANQGLMSTFKELQNAGKQTNKVMDQMMISFGNMFSFYGMKRLVQQIVTIGGQFEFQHVALQNILGDIQEANILFSQLQGLAVESPKTFMELTAYAKQLSAYQIPASELYDTTKRLADLSTGLGVDMGRLILAYGQVRSAAVLRGQELRQFTEAGIPLVQKLAEKFTELNGKLTTTADVFKLISARKVPFEMVKDILWDMTSQGGQFFNMQGELADTLYGKWQKLQDTWQIMLGHIADGNSVMGSFLRMTLEGIVAITKSLDTLMPMLGMIGVGRLYKSNKELVNRNIGKIMESSDTTAITTMRLAKEKEANRLMMERLQTGRALTAQEWELVRNKKILTSNDYLMLAYAGRISEYKTAQLALDGKINTREAYRLALAKGYTKEQIRQIQNGNLQMLQQGKIGLKEMFATGGIMGVIKGGGSQLFGGLMNFLGGWPGLIMTAIGAVSSLYSYFDSKNEELKQKGDAMASHAQQNANSLLSTLNNVEKSSDTTAKKIEVLEDTLIGMGEEGKRIVMESRKFDDISKRFETLTEKANAYQKALENIGSPTGKSLHEQALNDSGIEEEVKGYEDLRNAEYKRTESMAKFEAKYRQMVDTMKTKHKELNDTLTSNNLFENIRLLMTGKYSNEAVGYFAGPARDAILKYYNAVKDSEEAFKDLQEDTLPKVMDSLRAEAIKAGVDLTKPFEKLSETEKETLRTIATNFASSLENASETTKNDIANWIAHGFYAKLYLQPIINEVETGYADELRKWQEENGIQLWSKQDRQEAKTDIVSFGKKNGKLLKDLKQQKKDLVSISGNLLPATSKMIQVSDQIDEVTKKIEKLKKAKNEGVVPVIDPKSNNKSGGTKKDADLEKAKTRLDFIKRFYAEYKKYRDQYGPQKGQSMVEDIFGMDPGDGDEIIKNYKDVVKGVFDIISNNFNTEDRKKFQTLVKQLLADIDLDQTKDDAKRIGSSIKEELSRQAEQWNLYKDLFEKTGSEEMASAAFSDGKIWTDQALSMAGQLRDLMNEKVLSGSSVIIDWDAEEQTAEEYFKKNFENGEALFDVWKAIVSLLRNNYSDALKENAEAWKSTMNYADRIAAVMAKYKEPIENAQKIGDGRAVYSQTKKRDEELAQIQAEQLRDSINWDVVFGNMEVYTRDVLIDVRKNIKDWIKLNRNKADIKTLKEMIEAAQKLDDAISEKGGLFSGLSDARKNLDTAKQAFNDAAKDYALSVYNFGINSAIAIEAKERMKLAQKGVNYAQGDVNKEGMKTVNGMASVMNSISSLGKKGGASLSEVGGAISSLITTLAGTNTAVGNLISAIFSLLDAIGDDPEGFAENLFKNVGNGIYGVNSLLNINNNLNKTIDRWAGDDYPVRKFMIGVESLDWMKGPDDSSYQEALARYKDLIDVWDKLIDQKRTYLEESWGSEGIQAGKEMLNLLENMSQAEKELAKERLSAGSSFWSHSMGYRMWEGSYSFDGQNWEDVAGEISSKLGVRFSEMADMTNMTTEQLKWIRENYAGLWSKMDTDFREHIENIIQYGDQAKDTIEKIQEKLTGWNLDNIKSEWADLLATMENGTDELTDNLEKKLRNAILNSMVDNLYTKRLQNLIDSASRNDKYVNKQGLVATHHYDAEGNITDTDIASEFTREEYDELMAQGGVVAEDVTAIRDLLKGIYGWTDDDKNTSSSSNNVGKAITEQETNLWSSYLNAIRADVSVNRVTLSQILFAVQSQSQMPAIVQSQLDQLRSLVELARIRNGFVSEIRDILHRASNGGDYIRVK